MKEAEAAVDPRGAGRRHTTCTRPSAKPRFRRVHAGALPSGGVGGTRKGVKCLHAHLAWFLVGGDDPVGSLGCRALGIDRNAYEEGVEERMAAAGAATVAAIDCGTNSTRLLSRRRQLDPQPADADHPSRRGCGSAGELQGAGDQPNARCLRGVPEAMAAAGVVAGLPWPRRPYGTPANAAGHS